LAIPGSVYWSWTSVIGARDQPLLPNLHCAPNGISLFEWAIQVPTSISLVGCGNAVKMREIHIICQSLDSLHLIKQQDSLTGECLVGQVGSYMELRCYYICM
jgi:hypothetical protein